MKSCTCSKHSSEDDQTQSSAAKNPASFSMILPLSSSPPINFIHSSPFFRQPFNLNSNVPLLMETSNVVREVQKSIVLSVEKCLKMVDNLRSQNEVLDRIIIFKMAARFNAETARIGMFFFFWMTRKTHSRYREVRTG